MELKEKLLNIQNQLKAPKQQYNNFGKYNYRNCEDILEAVKPICKAQKAVLIISDEIILIGERYYVKATATLLDIETDKTISTTAFAREEENKKGMDGSQVTGASSSYARKYALNGLFDIDDTKDSDTTNKPEDKPETKNKPEDKQEVKKVEMTIEEAENLVTPLGTKFKDLSKEQLIYIINKSNGNFLEGAKLILAMKNE